MTKDTVTNDTLIYSLRRQQSKVNKSLKLHKNTIIENAYFLGDALILNAIVYEDFEILPKYTILFNRSEPMNIPFIENEEEVKNMYKTIKLYNKPEPSRLDVFYCTSLIACDKEKRLYKYVQTRHKDMGNDLISILNIDIDRGNVIIAISVNNKKDFLIFTGEEFLAMYEKKEIKNEENI